MLLLSNILQVGDVILIVIVVVGLIMAGLYFFNKWASKKYTDHQSLIDKTKMNATIFVIDKKKDKLENANLPKAAKDQMPKMSKLMKMPLVKAKVGPQIATFICDKKVFEALPVKKSVAVEISGLYIISMKGMKSDKEIKASAKAKKDKAKEMKKKAKK